MTLPDLLKIVAALQGAAVFCLLMLILVNYIKTPAADPKIKGYVILFFVSHLLLTWATIRSITKEAYPHIDIWHFLILTGYISSLIASFKFFKESVRRRNQHKLNDYINKNLKL